MNARGCPTLSSSPAAGRGASFALAPDRRVGSVLHRRPRVPSTRGRGTFTAGARHAGAEEENGSGSTKRTSAAGGAYGDGIGRDDASALPPGINAASTGAFAFTEGDELKGPPDNITWVATTLSIVDLAVNFTRDSTAALLAEGKRAIEGKSPMESIEYIPSRCLSGERECTGLQGNLIYPERCDGRLSSSSARHRRRVIHPPDPPRAGDVAPEPPSASSSSSHASSSAAAAQAPDGPVALLPSVVIRELGVDHRLETARRERPGQR